MLTMPVLIMFVGCLKNTSFDHLLQKQAAVKPLGLFFLGDETFGHKMPVKTGLKVGNVWHGRSNWFFWCAVALWPRHGGPFGLLRLQQWNGWSLDGMFVSIRSTSIYLYNLYSLFCTPVMIFFLMHGLHLLRCHPGEHHSSRWD